MTLGDCGYHSKWNTCQQIKFFVVRKDPTHLRVLLPLWPCLLASFILRKQNRKGNHSLLRSRLAQLYAGFYKSPSLQKVSANWSETSQLTEQLSTGAVETDKGQCLRLGPVWTFPTASAVCALYSRSSWNLSPQLKPFSSFSFSVFFFSTYRCSWSLLSPHWKWRKGKLHFSICAGFRSWMGHMIVI